MTAQVVPFVPAADLPWQVHQAFALLNRLTAEQAAVAEIEAAQRVANDLTRRWAAAEQGARRHA